MGEVKYGRPCETSITFMGMEGRLLFNSNLSLLRYQWTVSITLLTKYLHIVYLEFYFSVYCLVVQARNWTLFSFPFLSFKLHI